MTWISKEKHRRSATAVAGISYRNKNLLQYVLEIDLPSLIISSSSTASRRAIHFSVITVVGGVASEAASNYWAEYVISNPEIGRIVSSAGREGPQKFIGKSHHNRIFGLLLVVASAIVWQLFDKSS